MSANEQISTMARLYAERLMRGDTVSEAETRVIIAGLMLSVDNLANAFTGLKDALWSEEKMREMIRHEVQEHCKGERDAGGCARRGGGFAAWIGRLLRGFAGGGASVV